MAAGLSVDLDGWRREFDELMLRVGGRFGRVEPRRRMAAFVLGLLAGLPRVNCWSIAEHAGEEHPRGMQRLLSAAVWDEAGVRDDLRGYVLEHFADPGAVLVVDEDAQNTVREQCFDGGWQPGHQFTAPAAAPGTGLAAACWTDAGTGGPHLRVYYQDSQNTVGEQSVDGGQWQAGYLAAAAPGSGLAAARWLDAVGRGHLRVYYQDPQNVIREQCYDSGAWASGQLVVPTR